MEKKSKNYLHHHLRHRYSHNLGFHHSYLRCNRRLRRLHQKRRSLVCHTHHRWYHCYHLLIHPVNHTVRLLLFVHLLHHYLHHHNLHDLHLHPLVTNRAQHHQALIRAPRALLLLRLRHRQPLPRRDLEAAAAAAAAARPQGEARRALPAAGLAADDDRGQEADPALVPAHGRPAAQAARPHARPQGQLELVCRRL